MEQMFEMQTCPREEFAGRGCAGVLYGLLAVSLMALLVALAWTLISWVAALVGK